MAAKKYLYAVGRRKRSTAVVKLFPRGTGKYMIRHGEKFVTVKEYFGGHDYMIEDLFSPFTRMGDKVQKGYDAEIIVR